MQHACKHAGTYLFKCILVCLRVFLSRDRLATYVHAAVLFIAVIIFFYWQVLFDLTRFYILAWHISTYTGYCVCLCKQWLALELKRSIFTVIYTLVRTWKLLQKQMITGQQNIPWHNESDHSCSVIHGSICICIHGKCYWRSPVTYNAMC
jgi:signal transduction histidine kinase